jgi:outer membrane protein insertion porin family
MHIVRASALLLCLAGSAAAAQVYTAGTIEFVNPGPYSHAELETLAGIKPGAKLTADDLAASAQRIADSGFFDEAGASLMGRFSAMTVTYQLKPTPRSAMLHVGFQNMLWLTHDEIEAAIHAKVPLFRDYLPEGSPLEDTIKDALTDALAAKGVSATIAFATIEPTLVHPVREIAFRSEKPAPRVVNVKLSGVQPELVPYVQKSVNQTAQSAFSEFPAGLTTSDKVLAPLLDAGYAQARLTGTQVARQPAADGSTGVVLSATLDAGAIYRVAQISYAGMPLLSAEDFAKGAKLHPGDVASREALLETLAPIDRAYRQKGYMDVTIEAAPTYDTAAHTVAYTVGVRPGEPYRVNDISTINLGEASAAAFHSLFAMKAGEPFNPEYLQEFMKSNRSNPEFAGRSSNYTAYAHPRTHLVDLVIVFTAK